MSQALLSLYLIAWLSGGAEEICLLSISRSSVNECSAPAVDLTLLLYFAVSNFIGEGGSDAI